MQLNREQITYIDNYIQLYNIKYYEIYIEILDHIILSVEDILEEDQTISLEKAVLKAKEEGFGKDALSDIEESRVKLMKKQSRKEYWNHLKEYLTLPYLVGTLLYCWTCFELITFSKFTKIAVLIAMVGMVIYALADWTIKQRKYKNKNNFKILKTENLAFIYNLVNIWLILSYFPGSIMRMEGLNVSNSINMLIYWSIIFTMLTLSFIFYLKMSKKISVELQQQIFV